MTTETAVSIAKKIRENVVAMQAGANSWDEFKKINGVLWDSAAKSGCSDAVNVALKAIP